MTIYFSEEDIEVDRYYDGLDVEIRSAIDQSENERRSGNIRLGLRYRAENGSSGLYKKPCFGYRKNEDGDLVIDHYQAAVVRKIYRLYLSGEGINGIISALADEGIPSPQGSARWSKKTVSMILTNVKYTGNVEVMKTDPGRTIFYMQDAHEAIIPMEDFVRVQKEIERRTRKKRKHESAAARLIGNISWPEPQDTAGGPVREISWPEPE